MKNSIYIAGLLSLASISSNAYGFEQVSSQQSAGLSTASAGCYIDTPRYDVYSSPACAAVTGSTTKGQASFAVLGLNQNSGQFNIQYLDGTCKKVFNTTQEGKVCFRDIYPNQSITQRVRVTDTYTGQSSILTATAVYIYEPGHGGGWGF